MNTLTVPPSPSWYSSAVLACAPDDTLIYGGYHGFVVIKPAPENEPCQVRAFSTYCRIICVKCSPNWSETEQIVAIFSEDGHISTWDILKGSVKSVQKTNTTVGSKLVGGDFADADKVISVYEKGIITIWRMTSNEVTCLKDLFAPKDYITCMALNPHVSWMAAFGIKNGFVAVVDLRKSGRIIHKFKNHTTAISDLSWCPSPYNIFDVIQRDFESKSQLCDEDSEERISMTGEENKTDEQKVEANQIEAIETELGNLVIEEKDKPKSEESEGGSKELEDIEKSGETVKPEGIEIEKSEEVRKPEDVEKSEETIESEESKKPEVKVPDYVKFKNKPNPWVNLKHADDDEIPSEYPSGKMRSNSGGEEGVQLEPITLYTPIDFNDDCKIVLEMIENMKTEKKRAESFSKEETNENKTERKILKASRQSGSVGVSRRNVVGELKKDPLLASISKDGVICIWRISGNGKLEKKITTTGKNYKRRNDKTDKLVECVFWITPTKLISSGPHHKVLEWNFSEASEPTSKLIHNDHMEVIFCLTSKFKLFPNLEMETWCLDEDPYIWSYSRDRYLLKTSLKPERTVLCSYPTFGSCVSCFASSPIDPCRIAISSNFCKIWDLSRPHIQNVVMANFSIKSGDTLNSLAWHPEKEYCLAYGTAYGKVGLLNTNSASAPPIVLPQMFTNEVHKIEWGPPGNLKSAKYALYAISEGNLIYYNVEKPKDDPKVFPFNRSESVSNFGWKPDYAMIAVGTRQGSISLFSKTFVHLSTIYAQSKTILKIIWHPLATAEDVELSQLHTSFAATSGTTIHIYNTERISDTEMDQSSDRITFEKIENAHFKTIRDICWSPHSSGLLVSAGEDGVIQVTNTLSGQTMSTFYDEFMNPVGAVHWSPLDSNHIIVGLKNECLRIFNVSEHPAQKQDDLEKYRKKRTEHVSKSKQYFKKEEVDLPEEKNHQPIVTSTGEKHHTAFGNVLPNIYYTQFNSSLELCKKIVKKEQEKQEGSCEAIADSTEEAKTDLVLKFFDKRESFLEALEDERQKHYICKRSNASNLISLWKGDIGESIRDAIKRKGVTPWLVNMSAMVSPKLWQEACEAYALQQSDLPNCDPVEVSSYFLACHKIEEAVNVLKQHKLYREAYALAKTRLLEGDELIQTILTEWAKYEELCGQLEVATQIYTIAGKYEEGAMCLARRKINTEEEILAVALSLAKLSKNADLIASLELRVDKIEKFTPPKLSTRADLVLKGVTESKANKEETEDLAQYFKDDILRRIEEIKSFKEDPIKQISEDIPKPITTDDVSDN